MRETRGKEEIKKSPLSGSGSPLACSAPEESKAGADGDETEKKGDLEIRRRAFEIDGEGSRMRGREQNGGAEAVSHQITAKKRGREVRA